MLIETRIFMMKTLRLPVYGLCLLLVACAPSPEKIATQTAIAATHTSDSWTRTPTNTPTATATSTPANTATPTATLTPALPVGAGTPLPATLNLKVISPENLSQLKLLRSIPLGSFGVENVQFVQNEPYILIIPVQQYYSQYIYLVNYEDGTYQTQRGDGAVISPDGKTIAIYRLSAGTGIFSFENGQPTTQIKFLDGIGNINGSSPNAALLSFSPDGSLFAGDSRSGIHIYSTSDWSEVDLLPARFGAKRISPEWSAYALWGNGSVVFRTFPDDTFIMSDEHLNSNITFSPDGRYLAYNDFYGPVRIYDMIDPGQPWMVIQQNDPCYTEESIAFSQDNQLLALGCLRNGRGIINIWRIPDGTLSRTIQASAYLSGLTFSPDGKLLSAGVYTSVWPAQTQTELWLWGIP
jgi:hypothetical protein